MSPKTTSILYELYDVFPAGKGSSRRTRELLNTHNRQIPIKYTLICKHKINSYSNQENFTFPVKRLDSSITTLSKIQQKDNDPIKEGLSFRRAYANWLEPRLNQWDIIQCRSPWAGVVAGKQRRNKLKFIYEANGIPSIELSYLYPKFVKKSKKIIRKVAQNEIFCAFSADAIIVVSEVTKAFLIERGIPNTKIKIIYNGVNFKEFFPQRISFQQKKRLFNSSIHPIMPDDLILGYVGAFQSWQGLISLVKCLKMIIEHFPNLKLVLAGKSRLSWRKTLRNIAKDDGVREHLIILKEKKHLVDLPLIINAFDYAIAPLENTPRNTVMGCNPIKIYEYGACAKPIIVSDLPVIREILPENAAYFIPPPDDLGIFAEKIISCLNKQELAKKKGKTVYSWFQKENVSWKSRRKKLDKLYNSLISSSD
ncbi:MAG: glycosyltransferase family 4 protein [Candidatus Hodarchaeales archaeon]|jgi:glycosyltransferase involved in cell wall biosynthesis